MVQAYSFDKISVQKIKSGLLISVGGALLAAFAVFSTQVMSWLASTGPFHLDWRAIVLVAFGALSTSIINTGKQWVKGPEA